MVCNKLIQTSTIRILFVFGRIVASIIRIRPNTTHPLFGTALVDTKASSSSSPSYEGQLDHIESLLRSLPNDLTLNQKR